MPHPIATLNLMDQAAFVAALGTIFEHTPTIAEQAWHDRPFTSLSDLHQKMLDRLHALSRAEQLALIRAHPDLGSRAKMADASVQEQAGAGLDQLSPAEYQQFQTLNQAYKQRFGFPFIIAVKNHTKASILQEFDRRLHNSIEAEHDQAIAEISQIAWFRLTSSVVESRPIR